MVILLMLSMTIGSFAAKDYSINTSKMAVKWWTYGTTVNDYSSSVVLRRSAVTGNLTSLSNTNPLAYSSGEKIVFVSSTFNFDISHTYQVIFNHTLRSARNYDISVSVTQLTEDGYPDADNTVNLYELNSANGSKINEANFTFNLNNSKFVSSDRTAFLIIINLPGNLQSSFPIYLSDDITIIDKDDNSGFFDGVLGTLKHIFISIVGGVCEDGDYSSEGLFGKLTSGFTNLGDRISSFFDTLKSSIEAKIDGIQQWFIDLGDNIVDGLKSLFIPEDGYFESKMEELKSFFADHFGIVYTAADISLEVIRKLTSLTPPETAVLHVPAWQMQMPWDSNNVLTLVPESDVNFTQYINSSGVLHTFYSFYRGFISVVLIFLLIRYAMKKFDYVFGKDGEGTD